MSTIKANTLLHSDGTTTTQPSIPALAPAMAKAWVVFNGQGTLAIKRSYNTSSVTDNATGDYTLNWTTALPSDIYCESVQVSDSGAYYIARGYGDRTASLRDIKTLTPAGANGDAAHVSYIAFDE